MREMEDRDQERGRESSHTDRKRSSVISTPASITPISASAFLGKGENGTSFFEGFLSPVPRHSNSVLKPRLDVSPFCPLGQATIQCYMETLRYSLLVFPIWIFLMLLFNLAKIPSRRLHKVYHHPAEHIFPKDITPPFFHLLHFYKNSLVGTKN